MTTPQDSWAVSRFNPRDPAVMCARSHIRFFLCAGIALLTLAGCEAHQAAPVHHFGTHLDSAGSTGAVMVREGDTVWRISERYRLPLRDIIDINGLTAPYHLNAGQRLQLPPPQEYKASSGDTVTGIARMYGVPASQLVTTNKLAAPYRLKEGQVLRIPAAARPASSQIAVNTPPARAANNIQTTRPSTYVATSAAPVATAVTSAPPQPVPPESARVYPPLSPAVQQHAAAPAVRAATVTKTPASMVSTGAVSSQGFVWPIRGKVISSYGPKPGHLHNDGINIAAPRGAAVAAAAEGTVTYVGDSLASYGNLVLIRHSNGLVTAYAHLDRVHVVRGDTVKRGQAIGTVGSTGTVANPQLHFEVRKGIESLNPAKYLS